MYMINCCRSEPNLGFALIRHVGANRKTRRGPVVMVDCNACIIMTCGPKAVELSYPPLRALTPFGMKVRQIGNEIALEQKPRFMRDKKAAWLAVPREEAEAVKGG
jgi:hypothetical protein